VPIIYAQYLYWYWYWYLFVEYLIQDWCFIKYFIYY